MARRGHSVEVLTGFPNYPNGRVYGGYRVRPWQREEIDGIRVNRVALYPSHDRSSARRALNYISFALSASLVGPWLTRKPDVVYVYHPPATVGMPALLLKALKNVPVVYDVQDLWPETIQATGMLSNKRAMAALDAWCSFVYRKATHLTVLSPGFKRALIARGLPENKITVIPNWCDEENIRPHTRDESLARELGLAGRFNVMFAGSMGRAQGLETVLQAAAACARLNPAVQFVLIGDGVERRELESRATELGNVRFLPAQPMQAISRYLALADVLLVHLKDDPLFRITIPSKTQAYLATGKPLLMAMAGDAADVVERAGAGFVTPPGDAAALTKTVLRMADLPADELRTMGAKGRCYYLREMSMDVGIDRFEQLFHQLKHSQPAKR